MPCTRYPGFEFADVTAAGLEALPSLGIPLIEDQNQPGAVGGGRMPMSSRGGVRVTTADAYLAAGASLAGLTIQAGAEVSDIVFDGPRACGVRLVDGTVIEAGWVALCAGVYGSPAILLRSGIGPAGHLLVRGHPGSRRPSRCRGPTSPTTRPSTSSAARTADRHGASPILHVLGTFRSSSCNPNDAPDLMVWFADPEGEPAAFEITAVLLKPRSRGHVRLRSADPTQAPAITLPGLDDPSDVARLAEGYQRAQSLARSAAVRAAHVWATRRRFPLPTTRELQSPLSDIRCPTRPAPVRWGRGRRPARWSTPAAASTGRRASLSSTHRSCLTPSPASLTYRRS